MPPAATIRMQIEAALAARIPSALTLVLRQLRPVVSTGIFSVDKILDGGLPVGAITEIVGPECSGRTSFTLSFLARLTQSGKVCAWIDLSNALQPESAVSAGVELSRMLWVRCGAGARSDPEDAPPQRFVLPEKYLAVPAIIHGLHGGGCGGHPRGEVKGLSQAVTGLLRAEAIAPRCAESMRREHVERPRFEPNLSPAATPLNQHPFARKPAVTKPLARIEQALRVADLLLQGGGFSAIVLDMAGIAPEFSSRVPLATWFRYRAAAERSQTIVLLLTQHACAKSSAELVLQMRAGQVLDRRTVFTGVEHHVEVARRRFDQPTSNVIPVRKPPQRASVASWESRAAWTGR